MKENGQPYAQLREGFVLGAPNETIPSGFTNVDVVVALGRDWSKKTSPNPKTWMSLSAESIITSLAAASITLSKAQEIQREEEQSQRKCSRGVVLVLSGGKTENDYISEASAMHEAIENVFGDITKNKYISIIWEDGSKNTSQNMKYLKDYLISSKERGQSPRGVHIVTMGYHMQRANALAEAHGIQVASVLASERSLDAFLEIDPCFAGIYNSETSFLPGERRRERILNALLTIDPKGKIPGLITQFTRK